MHDDVDPAPITVRGAILAAQESLADLRPAHQLTLARAALAQALELLDGADREVGTFQDAEPFRLVLDPLPDEARPLALTAAS
jgi:hypothetical protein